MSLIPNGHRSGLFVHAPLDEVAECLISWGKEIGRGTHGEKRPVRLENAWPFVDESREFNPTRAFVISVGRGWTAFFDNHSREFLAQAKLSVLCRRLKVDTCFFSYDHSAATEHCGSIQFLYYQFTKDDKIATKTREVMLLKEGGWQFTQSGEPLPFEDLAAYERPKKKERLTPELLRQYGQAIGIPFWDSAAYGDTVYLLQWGNKGGPSNATVMAKLVETFGKPKAIFHGKQR